MRCAGRLSLAHARKSLAGAQLHQMGGQDTQQKGQRRSSVYEALSSRLSLRQGLSRVSLGLTGALNRLSLGPAASRRDSVTQVRVAQTHLRQAEDVLPMNSIASWATPCSLIGQRASCAFWEAS